MADVQIAIIDQQNTQIALAAPSETEVTVAVPGVQGPVGEGVPSGGTTNQVLFKQSGTDYDTAWSEVTSAMIGDLEITNADVAANAEIAVSKLADGAARQLLQTDAAGTGVEWTSNVDVPGTLDVTSTATFDSIASHPLGSAAAPTITFTGDTNTGIYSPGADQVAISTNGVQRLFVSNTGIISTGINGAGALVNGQSLTLERYTGSDLHSRWRTSNISAGLQLSQTVGSVSGGDDVERARVIFSAVSGTYRTGFQWFDDSGNTVLGYAPVSGRIYLGDSTNNGTLSSYLASGTNIAGGTLTIAGGQGTGTGAGGPIVFSTAAAGSSGSSVNPLTERMRIDSSGRLGLGTSAPDALLTVNGVGAHGLGSASAPSFTFTGDLNTGIYSPGADQVAISTNGTQRVLIKDSSQDTLRVTGTNAVVTADAIGSAYPGFRLAVNGGVLAGLDGEAASSASLLTYGAHPLIFGTSSAERLRITSDGKLGLGTSSPEANLQVVQAVGDSGDIVRIGQSQGYYLGIARSGATGAFSFQGNQTGFNNILLAPISGNVGVGTTSPGYALHVVSPGDNVANSAAARIGQANYSPDDGSGPHYGLHVRQLGARYHLNYGIYSEVAGDSGFFDGSAVDGFSGVRGIGVYGYSPCSTAAYQSSHGVYGKADNAGWNYNSVIGVRGRANAGTSSFTNNNSLFQAGYGGHFVSFGKANSIGVYADAYLDASPGAGQQALPLLVASNGAERLRVDASGTTTLTSAASTAPFIAKISSSEAARIDSSGRLGIGTSSPSEKLEVTGNIKLSSDGSGAYASSYNLLFYGTTSSSAQTDQAKIHSSTWSSNTNGGNLQFYTSNASNVLVERVRIDGAGNVGVGTTSPTQQCDIRTSSNDNSIPQLLISDAGNNAAITLGAHATYRGQIAYDRPTESLIFREKGSERSRIDGSGRLLVGTSTARGLRYSGANTAKVEIVNPGFTLALVNNLNDAFGDNYLAFVKDRGTGNALQSGDGLGGIQWHGSDGTDVESIAASILVFADGTPGTDDMPGRLVFSTTADGANFPTERMRITSTGQVRLAGAGITFNGDTATANELDDYEEGTWTPALVGTTAVSYSNQVGKYVKIGRMVHVQGLLQTSSQTFSDTAASLQISGLPFTPNDNTGYYHTPGSVSAQQLNFDAASNTQTATGDYLNTGISSNNIVFQITTKGQTRGEVRNLGWGTSGTGQCIAEFELTYYTTA